MNYQQKYIKYQQKYFELIGGSDFDITKHIICPITQQIMIEPVMASDGNTYEKKAIEKWLRDHNNSPMSGARLDNKKLQPNLCQSRE